MDSYSGCYMILDSIIPNYHFLSLSRSTRHSEPEINAAISFPFLRFPQQPARRSSSFSVEAFFGRRDNVLRGSGEKRAQQDVLAQGSARPPVYPKYIIHTVSSNGALNLQTVILTPKALCPKYRKISSINSGKSKGIWG